MKLNKKSEGLTLNVIVVAVLVLLVLIVLILIFTGKLSIFNIGVSTCPTNSKPLEIGATEDTANCYNAQGIVVPPMKVIQYTNTTPKKTVYCCPLD
jgi:hypothetical protein